MKLRTKISAAAIGMLLLFSQLFSGWLLFQMKEVAIQKVENDEWEKMNRKAWEFEQELRKKYNQQSLDEEEERFLGKIIFRNSRGGLPADTVLYYGKEELYNTTPYEFDLDRIKRKEKNASEVLREEVEGEQLLIFAMDIGNFDLIHYKEVTSIYEQSRELFYKGIEVVLFLAAVLLVVLSGIIRKILKPLYALKEAANSFTEGCYEKRVPVRSQDEVGEISHSFNQMADRIEEHICELREKNEKQRNLLGSLAHELKTPMTAIQGYAETLQRISLPPEKQARSLAYIEKECKRLSRLSAKMLELTELSGEHVEIEKQRWNIIDLLKQVKEMTRYRLREKKIHLEIEAEDDLEIQGDEDLLLSFLTNLVDNAYKASREGSVIRLIGKKEGIFVQDEGNGIPEEELKKITEPFYMVDKSRARKEGGAGLGLALCRQIAFLHGGKLVITSESGRGTRAGLVTSWLHSGEDSDTENLI